MAKITFLGAAGCVTGSKYMVKANGRRLLLDCGLFQGNKQLRLLNWERLPVDPGTIDWVVLTHAHIDHTGYLPRLVRDGFRGPIFATSATRDLCSILLPDSARLQEEDAENAAQKGYSKHTPPLPLYTEAEVAPVLARITEFPRNAWHTISSEFSIHAHDAGHILGAASIELKITENGNAVSVLFSGDVGRYDQPILNDPAAPPAAEFVVCETTYGDRDHPTGSAHDALAEIIQRVSRRGGTVIIPAFAVGRTQALLYVLRELEDWQRIPSLPVYVDSPMAISATELYERHHEEHDLDFTRLEPDGSPLETRSMHFLRTAEESKSVNKLATPCVIISASGMATGGRVLHHLARRLPDSRNAVVLAGFQAEGTRGRALLEGAKTLHIHGEEVLVKAEVIELNQFSAHADRGELLRWLRALPAPPRQTFLVHGEPAAREAFRACVETQLGWRKVTLPKLGESFDLNAA